MKPTVDELVAALRAIRNLLGTGNVVASDVLHALSIARETLAKVD